MKQCTVQAYQFFFTEHPSICRTLNEQKANELIQLISESISREKWDVVLMQLKEIEGKHKHVFNIRMAQRLSNAVHAASLFHGGKNDYYMMD